jgi:hypothetical protein
MASPQFSKTQICDGSCNHEENKKESSLFEKLLKKVGKK